MIRQDTCRCPHPPDFRPLPTGNDRGKRPYPAVDSLPHQNGRPRHSVLLRRDNLRTGVLHSNLVRSVSEGPTVPIDQSGGRGRSDGIRDCCGCEQGSPGAYGERPRVTNRDGCPADVALPPLWPGSQAGRAGRLAAVHLCGAGLDDARGTASPGSEARLPVSAFQTRFGRDCRSFRFPRHRSGGVGSPGHSEVLETGSGNRVR
jgi:hypothetical protein